MSKSLPPQEMARVRTDLRRVATGPAIISLLRQRDGMSRTELARKMGVSNQAVSKTVTRLMIEGLLFESGRQPIGVGKARTRLSLVSDSRFALGMHLDRTSALTSLVNLSGEVEASVQSSIDTNTSPEEAVQTLAEAASGLLDDSPTAKTRLVGGGLGIAGPVDHELGTAAPHNFRDWQNVPLAKMLSDRIGTPIVLDNEANMAMAAEHWRSGREGWTVVIYIGTGLRAAMMLDGEVYHGPHSNAGEVGHMVVDINGPICVCGRRGCVEVFSSPAAAVSRYRNKSLTIRPDKEGRGPAWGAETLAHLTELSEAAKRGESMAREALRESGMYLGVAAANLTAILDVDYIVLAGPLLNLMGPDFIAGAESSLTRNEFDPARKARIIVSSDVHSGSIARGSALVAMSNVGA